MMLFFGLGNPGRRYRTTRHNVGALCVERMVKEDSASWIKKKRFFWPRA